MKINFIEEINKYEYVKAFAIPKDQARWRIYSNDIKADMEDLKYYRELGDTFNITPDRMVRVPQKHSTNVRVVKKDTAGEGVVRMEVDGDCDGAITNEKGIMLLTIEADCTPVYILDKENKAIGMVHSGWRGTVNKITEHAIKLMQENYGTKKENLIIHFGPSICGNCYEVDYDLIPEFKKILDDKELDKVFKKFVSSDGKDKLKLDVTEGIKLSLLKYGIKESQMTRSKDCTYHSGIYDSWRLGHDKTKQMLTGIMLI